MKTPRPIKQFLLVLVSLLLLGLLAACSAATQPSFPPTPTGPAPTSIPPTATLAPTATPQAGKVLFWAPEGSDPQQVEQVKAVLSELSTPMGWQMEDRAAVEPAELGPEVKLVFLLAPTENLSALVAGAPQTQFIVASNTDVQTSGNLSAIRLRPENQAFVAGFIVSLISTDLRGAGLLPSDGSLGAGLQDAFVSGGRYFCGVCAPGWPLGEYYPQAGVLPASSDGAAWQAAAVDLFDNKKVDVFYLASEAMRSEVTTYLTDKDQFGTLVRVVGASAPPEELRSQWAATVRLDVPEGLRQLWPRVSTSEGGQVVDAPLALEDVDEQNLSAGKLRLVKETMEEIVSGSLSPFSVPAE